MISVRGVRRSWKYTAGSDHRSLSLIRLPDGEVVIVEVLSRLSSVLMKTVRSDSCHAGSHSFDFLEGFRGSVYNVNFTHQKVCHVCSFVMV